MIQPSEIDLNEGFLKALDKAENSDSHVLITGRAGTGKSTFLSYFRQNTKKKIAVLSPTGVAAVNVKGQTIHSFFGFRPDITIHNVEQIKPKNPSFYKKIDAIVIDEISMVRADLIDCVDVFLRKYGPKKNRPFGGIQTILIGDLYQLPPVVTSKEKVIFEELYRTPYFFSSRVFEECEFEFIEFERVYRQSDPVFVDVLNGIRNNTISEDLIKLLNSRYIPDFVPNEDEFYIYLVTTNKMAENINSDRLSKIRHKEFKYYGYLEGEFKESDLPTSAQLNLKVDAQVMLLNNDSKGRWINGDIGKILEIQPSKSEPDVIIVELKNGEVVEVVPYTWEMFEFFYDKKKKKISTEVVGQFTQYPLKLAWAITIHKSQGLTFDKVILDLGKGTFSHGQLYVALSRCRSFDGLILKRPVKREHILLDRKIVQFLTRFQYSLAEKKLPLEEKISFIEKCIEREKLLEIVYLKSSDIKTKRIIKPLFIGKMEFNGRNFLGLKAFCMMRREERNFNVEKIIEIREVD